MINYKTGHVVRTFIPFVERADKGKNRYAVVIGQEENTVKLLAINSRNKKVIEDPNYRFRPDELLIPHGVKVEDSKGSINELYGVIKIERVIYKNIDEIIDAKGNLEERTVKNIINVYDICKELNFYQEYFKNFSSDAVGDFENLRNEYIAQKLLFLGTSETVDFDEIKNTFYKINEIAVKVGVGNNKSLNIADLSLQNIETEQSTRYQIGTFKRPHEIAKQWGGRKTGLDWLKEDIKYKIMSQDISKVPSRPFVNIETNMQPFAEYKKRVLETEIRSPEI